MYRERSQPKTEILVTFLLSVFLAVTTALPSQADELCTAAATCEVTVDGITGKVADGTSCKLVSTGAARPSTCQWPTVYPGDKALVKIQRANLIHYAYDLEISKENLSLVYPVVGVGEISGTESLRGAETPTLRGAGSVDGKAPAELDLDGLKKAYAFLSPKLVDLTGDGTQRIDPIETLNRSGNGEWTGVTSGWPTTYGTSATAFFGTGNSSLDTLRTGIAGFEATSRALAQRAVTLSILNPPAAANPTSLAADPYTILKSRFDELAQNAQKLQEALTRAELAVRRWQGIIESNPGAVIEKTFLVDRKSQRYTVTVKRLPLTEVAKATEQRAANTAVAGTGTTPASAPAPATSTLASISFEGHAWHHFNVSLGLAETFRPAAGAYAVVSTIGGDGMATFHVRRSEKNELSTEPVALLGVYFNRIDNYDLSRKPAWMATLGTEISASPKTFLLGVAVDWPSGFVLGFGLLEYDKVRLAEGWKDGQEVPRKTDGTALLTTVPTNKKDSVGAYVTLAFRPGVFKAFWDRRK